MKGTDDHNYPRIRTEPYFSASDDCHLAVMWAPGTEWERYCGGTTCTGACGLPALVIPAQGGAPALKAHSNAGGCGSVFQQWRVKKWKGATMEVPEVHRGKLLKLLWL